jgi:hypothetical protein
VKRRLQCESLRLLGTPCNIMIDNGKRGTANIGVRFLPSPGVGIVGDREHSSYH